MVGSGAHPTPDPQEGAAGTGSLRRGPRPGAGGSSVEPGTARPPPHIAGPDRPRGNPPPPIWRYSRNPGRSEPDSCWNARTAPNRPTMNSPHPDPTTRNCPRAYTTPITHPTGAIPDDIDPMRPSRAAETHDVDAVRSPTDELLPVPDHPVVVVRVLGDRAAVVGLLQAARCGAPARRCRAPPRSGHQRPDISATRPPQQEAAGVEDLGLHQALERDRAVLLGPLPAITARARARHSRGVPPARHGNSGRNARPDRSSRTPTPPRRGAPVRKQRPRPHPRLTAST
jgi:hypothetical protein